MADLALALGTELGEPVATLSVDITQDAAPAAAVALAMKRFGRLDCLVNNAGIGSPKPVHETDDETLDHFLGLMLRALEMGTAGLKAPTGEAVDFPTNTSDALMSGGADALAGAVERMHRKLCARTGQEPALIMTGGAAVKLAPITQLPFETVDTLIFEGLLQLQAHRLAL